MSPSCCADLGWKSRNGNFIFFFLVKWMMTGFSVGILYFRYPVPVGRGIHAVSGCV